MLHLKIQQWINLYKMGHLFWKWVWFLVLLTVYFLVKLQFRGLQTKGTLFIKHQRLPENNWEMALISTQLLRDLKVFQDQWYFSPDGGELKPKSGWAPLMAATSRGSWANAVMLLHLWMPLYTAIFHNHIWSYIEPGISKIRNLCRYFLLFGQDCHLSW